ncbi:MAG: BREX-1 system adenine-specific DNA-methyltransferase PglX [Oscillospiraceae bacterium]
MNKTAIKNFAIWARNKLIADIQYRAGLMGITADGIKEPLPQSTGTMEFYDIGTAEPYAITGEAIPQRKKLAEVIRRKEKDSNYATAYKYILEEVAYTWFNRLIAIRFMEVNDYLPSHIRVLSSESGKIEPDLVTTPFDAELAFTPAEEETVLRLKTENKLDELFRLLFIKQCNALNEILPALFEKTSDYTELLLNLSVVDQEGVVYHLIHDIDEDDFNIEKGGQVEIIGWLYQYYNTEPKNAAFAKNGKITKEEIPAVTQLFTPDWIVRYMVENSLGRIFIDKRKEQGVFADGRAPEEMTWEETEAKRIANEKEIAGQMGWKYYLPEAAQTREVRQQLDEIQRQSEYKDVRDIKVIDPCMGSGHILVYAFDVLMQMYENDGYSQRDAAQCILEHNLYGLDIDERAAQLAYFAVMMKARQYDRRIFSRGIQPHVYAIAESNGIDAFTRDYFANNDPKLKSALNSIMNDLRDAKEYGSILTVSPVDFAALYARAEEVQNDISFHRDAALNTILPLIRVAEALAQKYDVVVTNPPYMGAKSMSPKLGEYVNTNYADTKSDLFSIFIEKGLAFSKKYGYNCMVTMQSWLFLSSFEKMRSNLLTRYTLNNMLHMGNMVMGIAFGTAVSNIRKIRLKKYRAVFNFVSAKDITNDKPVCFPLRGKRDRSIEYDIFDVIPGMPIAYWASEVMLKHFLDAPSLGEVYELKQGLITADNERFLRRWAEISSHKLVTNAFSIDDFSKQNGKWLPYNKGGEYRKWYGNNDLVVNWEHEGFEIRNFKNEKGRILSRPQNIQYFGKEGASWSIITNGSFSLRYTPKGFGFDARGSMMFAKSKSIKYGLALMCSKVAKSYLDFLSPTVSFEVGNVSKVPFLFNIGNEKIICDITEKCISLSKFDWDSYETSWDFQRHPLVRLQLAGAYAWGDHPPVMRLSSAYNAWKLECEGRFEKLKANEEELNRIFIDIYGLQDELTPEVADKDVTVHRIFDTKDDVPESMQGSSYVRTKRDEVVSLLSYAVGCMFGRYSLDRQGLIFAGGNFDSVYWKFKGQAALNEQGDPIDGGYAGISLANYHYPKFHDAENWEDATSLSYEPDVDGVIPITDEEYLEDDIVSRLCSWLKAVYGADTLEDNLDFIAGALGGKGNSSREIIRSYFLKDFFKDHCKTYQKRPIYWLFDSGKQNGFKALIYLHRYTPDTIGNLRVDYLHKMQRVYESEINRMQDMIDHSTNAREVAASTKRKEKLQKQLKECRDYDEMIAHLALSRIELDLDDGVKVNYEKIQTASDGKKYAVLAKI